MKWLLTAWRRFRDWRETLTCKICGEVIRNHGDRALQMQEARDHWLTKHSHEAWS